MPDKPDPGISDAARHFLFKKRPVFWRDPTPMTREGEPAPPEEPVHYTPPTKYRVSGKPGA